MSLSKKRLVNLLPDFLDKKEMEQAVSYVVRKPFRNIDLKNLANGRKVNDIIFIDYFPGMNWTHKSLYIHLDQNGNVIETIENQLPPRENFFLLKKPGHIEKWKLLATEVYGVE